MESLGTVPFAPLEDDSTATICEQCGKRLEISDYPFCPHGKPSGHHKPFSPYFDDSLGIEVTSDRQREKHLKSINAFVTDGLSKGDLSARRDKVMQIRREAAQGHRA